MKKRLNNDTLQTLYSPKTVSGPYRVSPVRPDARESRVYENIGEMSEDIRGRCRT